MIPFELTNEQRVYFGLDPIETHWDRVIFPGDKYRPESYLYFDGNIIKRHIISTNAQYTEKHYDDLTRSRTILLPKTNKGKEKKLSPSVLEQRQPGGVYLDMSHGKLNIGNYDTQTTFYSSSWDPQDPCNGLELTKQVDYFISSSPQDHLHDIRVFKNAKRKNIRYKAGDYFTFKLNRTEYGFGRILLSVSSLLKNKLLPANSGLFYMMGKPLLVQAFAYTSTNKNILLDTLTSVPVMPTVNMMDNVFFYGEYEIIGWKELAEEDFEFPISYRKRIEAFSNIVFLQWGLIHRELPLHIFDKYLRVENTEGKYPPYFDNPYGYYSTGFQIHYDADELKKTLAEGSFDFNERYSGRKHDLRNPKNSVIRNEILEAFGLDPLGTYEMNRHLTSTIRTTDLLRKLESV